MSLYLFLFMLYTEYQQFLNPEAWSLDRISTPGLPIRRNWFLYKLQTEKSSINNFLTHLFEIINWVKC